MEEGGAWPAMWVGLITFFVLTFVLYRWTMKRASKV